MTLWWDSHLFEDLCCAWLVAGCRAQAKLSIFKLAMLLSMAKLERFLEPVYTLLRRCVRVRVCACVGGRVPKIGRTVSMFLFLALSDSVLLGGQVDSNMRDNRFDEFVHVVDVDVGMRTTPNSRIHHNFLIGSMVLHSKWVSRTMHDLETHCGVHVKQNLRSLFRDVIDLTSSGLETLLPSIVKYVTLVRTYILYHQARSHACLLYTSDAAEKRIV